MNLQFTGRFAKEYERLPRCLQRRVSKAPELLLENPRHPSLHIKKVTSHQNRWEGRVTLHYRLIFTIEDDSDILLRLGTHDLLK